MAGYSKTKPPDKIYFAARLKGVSYEEGEKIWIRIGTIQNEARYLFFLLRGYDMLMNKPTDPNDHAKFATRLAEELRHLNENPREFYLKLQDFESEVSALRAALDKIMDEVGGAYERRSMDEIRSQLVRSVTGLVNKKRIPKPPPKQQSPY